MDHAPVHTYALAGWIFLRLLGLIYLVAFLSLAPQIKGLIGREGILPVTEFLRKPPRWNLQLFFSTPTLFWFNASDGFLSGLCWGGAFLSLLLTIGFAPLPVLILVWVFYLSLFTAGRGFMGYQWDVLLLEAGFLAVFLAPLEILPRFPPVASPSPVIIWLLRWLLFRLMFSSGMVKFLSGDRNWRSLDALRFHYETQPLPAPVAWWAHQLPAWFHRLSAASVLAIEIIAPFMIPGSAWMRMIAAALFIGLMLLIQLTGNYAFFNLLAIALCVPLFDDQMLGGLFGLTHWQPAHPTATSIWVSLVPAALVLILSPTPIFKLFHSDIRWPNLWERLIDFLTPFRLVNSYGLFSIMTIERPEIIIEGSQDGREWEQYEFHYKPGDVRRAPRFVAPHQPRLDWQMWFAAMGFYHNHVWVGRLMRQLMEGAPPVEALLKVNPFQKTLPRFIRCVLYDYRFTSVEERRKTGAWWRRDRRGLYGPELKR